MQLAAALLVAAGFAFSAPASAFGQPIGTDVQTAARRLIQGELDQRAVLDAMARRGRKDAAEVLGQILWTGQGLEQDLKAACEYSSMSSGARAAGTHNHAFCYEQGITGEAPDLARAAELYAVAANLGYAKSNCALGNLYIAGRGVAQDGARGLALCRLAADAGVADAQTDVGDVYLRGKIVPKDVAQARYWYEKAAAQSQRNAVATLGAMNWNGDGAPRNPTEAVRLWRIAYTAGRRDVAAYLANEAEMRAHRHLTANQAAAYVASGDPAGIDQAALAEAIQWYERAIISAKPSEISNLEAKLKAVRALTGPTEGKP